MFLHHHSEALKAPGTLSGSTPNHPVSIWVPPEGCLLCFYLCCLWLMVKGTAQLALRGAFAVHTCCLRVITNRTHGHKHSRGEGRLNGVPAHGTPKSLVLEHLVPECCLAPSLVWHNTRNVLLLPRSPGGLLPDVIPFQRCFPEGEIALPHVPYTCLAPNFHAKLWFFPAPLHSCPTDL